MAYPTKYAFDKFVLSTYSPSIGASPAAAYAYIPARCKIERVNVVANGTITSADCSIAVAINGTAISGSPFTLPVAQAGAGETATLVPTSFTYANDGDYVSFTPSGASGSSISAMFTVECKGDRG